MSDTIIKNIALIFFILGLIGICVGPLVSISMGNKYDVNGYAQVYWPLLIGFLLYIASYALYFQPNDTMYEKIILVFICGSILFSLSAITLISLRITYAA